MSVSTLSRVQRDLLANDSHPYALLPPDDEKRVNNVAAYKKNPEAPKRMLLIPLLFFAFRFCGRLSNIAGFSTGVGAIRVTFPNDIIFALF